MTSSKPARTEPWYVKIQLGNWVGHVSLPPQVDAKEAHALILEAAANAADEITASLHKVTP